MVLQRFVRCKNWRFARFSSWVYIVVMLNKLHFRSARIGVIVILVTGLLVGVGYALWMGKDAFAPSTVMTNEASDKDSNAKQYATDTYSFSYPAEGWMFQQGDKSTNNNPSLETKELITEGTVIKKGAGIYIRTFPASEGISYDDLIKNPDGLPAGIYTDIKKMTLGGAEGQSYTLNYEGTRYITEAVRGDTTYQIIFKVAKDQKLQYEGAYKQVVSSFKFK